MVRARKPVGSWQGTDSSIFRNKLHNMPPTDILFVGGLVIVIHELVVHLVRVLELGSNCRSIPAKRPESESRLPEQQVLCAQCDCDAPCDDDVDDEAKKSCMSSKL